MIATIEHRQAELDQIFNWYAGDPLPVNDEEVKSDYGKWTQEDKDLCTKIAGSKQGEMFQSLFAGKLEGYGSQSEADLAFCSILAFWTAKNPAQMDRIFRKSELYRSKWDEKHGESTYGETTIQKAIAGSTNTYKERISTEYLENTKGVSPKSILEKYSVKKEYVEKLGKEEFLFDNLIIKNHILTIIAESGGGKTTFLYFHVAKELAKKGFNVWYIDADSPPSDHKVMKELADEHVFSFIIPDVNQGTSAVSLVADITAMTEGRESLEGYVFFFDTLKKFIDLMSKKDAKNFFVLMRKLTKLGGTVVLPGHANKHRDKDGHLVFEGVGDVKSDSDDLIFFEKVKKADGSIDVTTVVDSDKGAKVRGIFRPFSFHIDQARQITFYDNPLAIINLSNTGVHKATDEEIIVTAEQYLKIRAEPVVQKILVEYTADKVAGQAGKKKVREVLAKKAVLKEDAELSGTRFIVTIGERNAHMYELPKKKAEQASLW